MIDFVDGLKRMGCFCVIDGAKYINNGQPTALHFN
jgi:hypothetical protein